MRLLKLLVPLVAIAGLVNACKKDDAQPQSVANVLTNGDFETSPYQDWKIDINKVSKTKSNGYTIEYSTEAASSPSHSMKVSCNGAYNDSTYQLIQQFFYLSSATAPAGGRVISIPTGGKLTMKVKIKTVNIQGNGISIAIGGNYGSDRKYETAFYTSTEGKTTITGTNDFKEYAITFDSFPANMHSMYALIFFLPNTIGTAYYDDVSLSVN
ncbi:hypothetical protein [Spirosoma rhododendri]|uniref:Uncharacterized protein n=1 Tax=Spirosoma rhododendri TaxID=2728024 RepID=A0A7L5DQP7_9BACT|nr:hypothetical protein [Spirosoma rhododendri]QJD79922.1 hypothetical protein HH216_16990 [Spirosoma rhododendri]